MKTSLVHYWLAAVAMTLILCCQTASAQDEVDDDKPDIVVLKFPKKLRQHSLYCNDDQYEIGAKKIRVDDNDPSRCQIRLWSKDNILVDQYYGWFDSEVADNLDPNSLKIALEIGSSAAKGTRLNNMLTSNRMNYFRLRLVDANSRIGLAVGLDVKESGKKEKDLFEAAFGVSSLHVGLQLRQSARGVFESDFLQKIHGSLEVGLALGEVWYQLSDGKNELESQGGYAGFYGEFSLEYPIGRDVWISYSGAAERGFGKLETDYDLLKSYIPLTIMSYTLGVGYGI